MVGSRGSDAKVVRVVPKVDGQLHDDDWVVLNVPYAGAGPLLHLILSSALLSPTLRPHARSGSPC